MAQDDHVSKQTELEEDKKACFKFHDAFLKVAFNGQKGKRKIRLLSSRVHRFMYLYIYFID